MKHGLRFRLSLLLIGVGSGMLLIAGISMIVETHYHFRMYQDQYGMDQNMQGLNLHLEQALLQSIVWTLLGAVILTILISLYVAKRFSAPLIEMKRAAEQMTQGKLSVRTIMKGNDELADLGNTLNHLAEQLQKQERLRISMTEDIAHELRTPLATLKSHMLAMLDQIWEPTPARIRACYEETERLISLVADLEQLTSMDSPHFRLVKKLDYLPNLIDQSANIVIAAFMEKGVQLVTDSIPAVSIHIDRDRFIQMLVNILSNALKFTPEGGLVRIGAENQQDMIVIAVQDTGTGIDSAELPYVFERFYRTDKSRNRKFGGNGIGLTIVKKLVEAHGGTVWIESTSGTTVFISLPK
ncbi:ATP-binding protein [Paenibacillus sp. GYB004]|uniref:sensor histidine kinase n=1 Tax=Paenibacillus sp. GYB004 TaxID=2994393 RepID=UPI002F964C8C